MSLHTYQNGLKNITIPTVDKDTTDQLKLSDVPGGEAKWYSHTGKQFGSFSTNQMYNCTPGHLFQRNKNIPKPKPIHKCSQKFKNMNMVCIILLLDGATVDSYPSAYYTSGYPTSISNSI